MTPRWTSRGLLAVATLCAACTGPPRVVADALQPGEHADGVDAEETVTTHGEAPVEPPPSPGSLAGHGLQEAASTGVPAIEQGLSGLLATLPRMKLGSGAEIEEAWLAVKKERDTTTQHRQLASTPLFERYCDDVIDVRSFEGRGLPPFGWRDRVRDRTYASPAMAATLSRALATLRSVYPDARVSLGDIAQVGCGSLNHGTLVHHVADAPFRPDATRLLNRARISQGEAMVVEDTTAAAYPQEMGRFPGPETAVRVEHRLLAWDMGGPSGGLRLRVATRRYIPYVPDQVDAVAPGRAVAPSLTRADRVMGKGRALLVKQVATWRGEDGLVREWLQHWGSRRHRSQVRSIGLKKNRGRVLKGRREIRLARWQKKKPGSYPAEVVWLATGEGNDLEPWQSLYEAGHISHLSGRDADLSYVTHGNLSHFGLDVPNIDADRTWFWITCLREAAASFGATLDRVLVSRRVYRHLQAALDEETLASEFWMTRMMIVGGHGAHHHIRVAGCDEACESASRSFMGDLPEAPPEALVLSGLAEEQRQRLAAAAAAAKPDATDDSTPTPSR